MLMWIRDFYIDIKDPTSSLVLHHRYRQSAFFMMLAAVLQNPMMGIVTLNNYTHYWTPGDYATAILLVWVPMFFTVFAILSITVEDKSYQAIPEIPIPSAVEMWLRNNYSRYAPLIQLNDDGTYKLKSTTLPPEFVGGFWWLILVFVMLFINVAKPIALAFEPTITLWPALFMANNAIALFILLGIVVTEIRVWHWTNVTDRNNVAIKSGKDE